MAIMKHFTSKNDNYSSVLDYMVYEHKEHGKKNKTGHYEPILDEYGLMIERKNCAVIYLKSSGEEGDPERWATDCYITNNKFNQNKKETDRKNHMYVLSFNPDDSDKLNMKKMKEIALKFAKENFKGYQCLIGIHMDKDHYHIHFNINSCRDQDREQQPYMALDKNGKVKNSEVKAGLKHDDSPYLRRWLNDRARDICLEYGLDAKDMNKIHDDKQKEQPDKKEILRNEILQIARQSTDMDDFRKRIKKAGMNYRWKKTEQVFTSFTAASAKRATRMDKMNLTMDDILQAIDKNINQDKTIKEEIDQTIQYTYPETIKTNNQQKTTANTKGYHYRNTMQLWTEDGRKRGTVELLFMLAATLLSDSSNAGERYVQSNPKSTANKEIQELIDGIALVREYEIDNESVLAEKLKACGEHINTIRGEMNYLNKKSNGVMDDDLKKRLKELQTADTKYRKQYAELKNIEKQMKKVRTDLYQYNIEDYEGKTIEDIVNDLARTTSVSLEENKSTDERIRAAEKLKETQTKTNSMAKEIDRSER